MNATPVKTPTTSGALTLLINRRLQEPRNLIRDGLEIAHGVEAMGTYLSIYRDDVPGIMSVSSGADIIIGAFERIGEQLDFIEETLEKEAVI